MNETLIVYYSLFGATHKLAQEIARQTSGTMERLIPEKEYSFDYNTASKEIRNEIARGYCPRLKSENVSIDKYDVIFLGSPNWFKTFSPPLLSFLRKHDFSDKKIVPFCTHGGGGLGQIENDIAKECPNAKMLPGLAVTGDFSPEQVKAWLEKIGCGV